MDADELGHLKRRVTDLEEMVERLSSIMNDRPRQVFMTDVIRWRVPRDLPEMMREFPRGPTARDIARRYNLSQAITIAGLRELAEKGKIQWTRLKRSSKWVVLPPGHTAPDAPISSAQQRLLDGLKKIAGGGRTVTVGQREVARALSVHPSTVQYQIKCLIDAERLVLEKVGEEYEPSTYRFVVQDVAVDDKDVWRAAFGKRA